MWAALPMRTFTEPNISIAMATYNGERYIREQLDSLSKQTLLPLELVITDDGSKDSTLDIIQDFTKTCSFPVRVHRNQQRLGYSDNFLRAASLCRGDLISFCDQDDFWLPEKLSKCARHFAENPGTVLIVHSAHLWDGRERSDKAFPLFPVTGIFAPGSLDPYTLIPGFAQVFRRDLLNIADNACRLRACYDLSEGSKITHDSWIFFLATNAGDVALSNEPLSLYRQHEQNAVGVPKRRALSDQIRLTATTNMYQQYAEFYEESATVLLKAAENKPEPLHSKLLESAARLRKRACFVRLRSLIHSEDTSMWRRVRYFTEIFVHGGYSPSKAKITLGPRSALKDLLWGIGKSIRTATSSVSGRTR